MTEKDENEKTSSYGVFTEEQRNAVRKKLLVLAREREKEVPTEKEMERNSKRLNESNIPLLVDQEFHTSFTMKESYRPELDEIAYLFLLRTYFCPYLFNETRIDLDDLRYLSEVVGVQSTMLEESIKGYTLSGEMTNGGPIKFISFQLTKAREAGMVKIKNIVLYTKKDN